ncbi:bacterioferritin-associated ferredoxin [Dokdonella koreensis]|uniref:Bacterioferritin-associated ferredoxin n=1 Tax=Dokdonella koreensis DS-123 TaxID=1300342 RepID=A0A161HRR6_9GAMM|nr:bacterioferritin-associated ferredoxin [Dokdonella koreensis]ANB19322.1 BFD-like (2Fe-2S) binding domain superfamily protein [Dokdonella koreensis DS-123]
MYVCICNAVTDRQIRQAAADGVSSLAELSERTGCSDCCGTCAPLAGEILAEALRATPARRDFPLPLALAA